MAAFEGLARLGGRDSTLSSGLVNRTAVTTYFPKYPVVAKEQHSAERLTELKSDVCYKMGDKLLFL